MIFLTQSRLILVHKAKVGRGSLALSSLLGRMASGVEGVRKAGEGLGKLARLKPDEILALDSDNFAMPFNELVSLSVEPGGWSVSNIILVGKDRKIELSASSVAIEGLRSLIQSLLGQKFQFRPSKDEGRTG